MVDLNVERVFDSMDKKEVKVVSENIIKVGKNAERKVIAEKVLNLLEKEGIDKKLWTKILSRAYHMSKIKE